MASVNKQIIVGRLGKDVEVKQGQNQQPQESNGGAPRNNSYCFVGVATDDVHGKNADGTWKTETTWHNVNVYGQQAEYLGKYGKKGGWVYIEGRTQHKKDEKTGTFFTNVVASQVIVFDMSKGSDAPAEQKTDQQVDRGAARAASQGTTTQTTTVQPEAVTAPADDADELPF